MQDVQSDMARDVGRSASLFVPFTSTSMASEQESPAMTRCSVLEFDEAWQLQPHTSIRT